MLEKTSALWLPFTQMESFDPASRTFVRGEGNYLIDAGGKRVFDAVSSIWTTIHGHCHPKIVEAIARQAAELDHATLLGASNPVAAELAARLASLLQMDYAFFASDGASAIEAALKMALHYWQNHGQPQRTRFVRLVDSYHGDTSGAMSLSDIAVFKSRYTPLTFETLAYDGDLSVLERDDVAAIVVEPIVQAAAGIRIVPHERYDALRSVTPLLIVDEIATGFGRTGTMFAHEQLGLRPDILCAGKGITGGALALSVTMAREPVYEAFLGAPQELKQLFHGHSYAGNPIACAAAIANLEVFESERTLERARLLAREIQPSLQRLAPNPLVREVRAAGLMIGVEIEAAAWEIADALYERGHFTRPIGATIQLVPPLSGTLEELQRFLSDLDELLTAH